MANLERTYNIPLRKEYMKVPEYKRAKKAMTAVREFVVKHMKSENVLLGNKLNEYVWRHGIKNPPHHVDITAIKDSEGVVRVELTGKEYLVVKQQLKEEKDDSLMGKLRSKVEGTTTEDEKVDAKETVKTDSTPVKEEVKTETKKEETKPAEAPKAPAEKVETEKVEEKAPEPKAPAEKQE